MELCIWFENGTTAYFTDVEQVEEDEFTLRFKYVGRTSKKSKEASFFLDAIAGYSSSEE